MAKPAHLVHSASSIEGKHLTLQLNCQSNDQNLQRDMGISGDWLRRTAMVRMRVFTLLLYRRDGHRFSAATSRPLGERGKTGPFRPSAAPPER
jgi:hypothetical protein